MSDRGYEGWRRNFYTLWAAELTAIIGFQAMQPFLPYYIQEFDVEDLTEALVWAGRMGTSAGLAMAVSAPVWGPSPTATAASRWSCAPCSAADSAWSSWPT